MSMPALSFDYIDQKTHHAFHLPLTIFKKPVNDEEYNKLNAILDQLIDEVRDDEKHPLALAMQIIGENMEQYDNEHYHPPGKNITSIDMVKHLMTTNNLLQKDLADIFGGQANVSKFLNGERELSKSQILALKNRFGISTDFFLK